MEQYQSSEPQISLKLYCDSPQCRQILNTDSVVYSQKHNEVYHNSACALIAAVHKSPELRKSLIKGIEKIDLGEALKLLNDRKLTQSQTLDDKVGL